MWKLYAAGALESGAWGTPWRGHVCTGQFSGCRATPRVRCINAKARTPPSPLARTAGLGDSAAESSSADSGSPAASRARCVASGVLPGSHATSCASFSSKARVSGWGSTAGGSATSSPRSTCWAPKAGSGMGTAASKECCLAGDRAVRAGWETEAGEEGSCGWQVMIGARAADACTGTRADAKTTPVPSGADPVQFSAMTESGEPTQKVFSASGPHLQTALVAWQTVQKAPHPGQTDQQRLDLQGRGQPQGPRGLLELANGARYAREAHVAGGDAAQREPEQSGRAAACADVRLLPAWATKSAPGARLQQPAATAGQGAEALVRSQARCSWAHPGRGSTGSPTGTPGTHSRRSSCLRRLSLPEVGGMQVGSEGLWGGELAEDLSLLCLLAALRQPQPQAGGPPRHCRRRRKPLGRWEAEHAARPKPGPAAAGRDATRAVAVLGCQAAHEVLHPLGCLLRQRSLLGQPRGRCCQLSQGHPHQRLQRGDRRRSRRQVGQKRACGWLRGSPLHLTVAARVCRCRRCGVQPALDVPPQLQCRESMERGCAARERHRCPSGKRR